MAKTLLERLEDFKGLLNTPLSQKQSGLLDNIPQGAILGSSIFSQGIQGKDPFSALLPAVTQTAQLKKLMTPKNKDNFRLLSQFEVASVPGLDINKAYQMNTVTKKIVPVSGVGGTSITMNSGGQTEFEKTLGKGDAETVLNLRKDAETATNQNTDLSLITALSANLKTGAGGVLLQDLAKIGERFGVDMNWLSDYGQSQTIANSEAVQVLASNVTLDAISKTKGSISDKEMTFFQSIAPNLGMSPEGIQKTVEITRRINNRKVLKSDMLNDWIADDGSGKKSMPSTKKLVEKDDGTTQMMTFNQMWSNYTKENDLFNKDEMEELTSIASENPDGDNIQIYDGNKYYILPGGKVIFIGKVKQ